MNNLLHALLYTEPDYVYLLLRMTAGSIIFPYGMQKLLGWFADFGGGVGVTASLAQMRAKHIPAALGWLITLGQSVGSVMLLLGCFSRLAAAANFLIFTGAVFVHAPEGWTMNWLGKKRGEGVEYFILLLAILAVVIVRGSGPCSFDYWLYVKSILS
ncbi:MAG: DoxX family protein [Janthinobacterium lividum]